MRGCYAQADKLYAFYPYAQAMMQLFSSQWSCLTRRLLSSKLTVRLEPLQSSVEVFIIPSLANLGTYSSDPSPRYRRLNSNWHVLPYRWCPSCGSRSIFWPWMVDSDCRTSVMMFNLYSQKFTRLLVTITNRNCLPCRKDVAVLSESLLDISHICILCSVLRDI